MKTLSIAQLILRIALSLGFFLPVMDRIGWLGEPGSGKVAWGDWAHFADYTHSLMPFLTRELANIFAYGATIAEVVLGLLLFIGFKTKSAALGTGILTLTFALFMILSQGIGAPFRYPVFVFTGGALLLSTVDSFDWSLDKYLKK